MVRRIRWIGSRVKYINRLGVESFGNVVDAHAYNRYEKDGTWWLYIKDDDNNLNDLKTDVIIKNKKRTVRWSKLCISTDVELIKEAEPW